MEKLFLKFNNKIKESIKLDLSLKNIYEVPEIDKIVVSCGIGDFKDDDKMVKKISDDISKITGLKPKINMSKKAVSSFKLRIGQPVGLTTTLRGEMMYDFLDRLINVAIPRVRDFRGLPLSSFDGHGNYCISVKEHTIFPEIKYEDVTITFGFQVNINTTTKNDNESKVLLKSLGFPFEKKEHKNG